MFQSMILVVLMLVLGGCGNTSISDRTVRWDDYYELLLQVQHLEDEHYFSVLGPMARQYFYEPEYGSGVYAYTDGKLVKIQSSADPDEIVTIAGHSAHGWAYCVYRSYYWHKAPKGELELMSRGIIEEGVRGTRFCNPADRFRDGSFDSAPEVRILPSKDDILYGPDSPITH